MATSPSPQNVEWVTKDIIRQIFNSNKYYEKLNSGKLKSRILKERHPHFPNGNEPFCTKSQIVCYYTLNDKLIAMVHQYLHADGSLGASGLPDPKRIYLDDRIISVKTLS